MHRFQKIVDNAINQGLLNSFLVGSKECYVLSFKELFCIAGVTKPHAIITYFFLSLCLFLSVCFYAVKPPVKGISLEPT